MSIQLFIGTAKGAFVARSNDDRTNWAVEGPVFKGWNVTAVSRLPDARFVAGTNSYVYGPQVHTSTDLRTWEALPTGPSFRPRSDAAGGEEFDQKEKSDQQNEDDPGPRLEQIWTLRPIGDALYAGVAEAGLFRSNGSLESWEPVTGLNEHPTRAGWQPGMGGLCAHVVLADGERLWCGISAVGVFRSDDGGATWFSRNEGVSKVLPDQEHDEIGWCVHGLAADPGDPNRIYRQDHSGMYRTTNGGDSWERIENGLPSSFGFPIVVDARGRVFVIPLESDEYRMPSGGRLRVYRSTDGGDSWHALEKGLPHENAFSNVLRGAFSVDGEDPPGLYFGTTGGDVYVSTSAGEEWAALPVHLPRIQCVAAFANG